jgi:predicted TIM-barrel fold metal-dependent hydrolase
MTYKLISVDTHADEPEGLYRDNVASQYRDRVPQILRKPDGRAYIMVDGVPQIRMDNLLDAEPSEWQKVRIGEGSWEPEKRLAALDRDGVAAEITEASDGFFSLMAPDAGLQMSMAKVWNDWAMSTYKPYFDRLRPCALLPVLDIPAAVEEAKRIGELGYTCVFMPAYVEEAYRSRAYDPLWAVLQEANLTINLHMRTGVRPNPPFEAGRVFNYVDSCLDCIPVATDLCSSGVLERFPGIHVVFQEAGAGWVSWLMHTMDGVYDAYPEQRPADLKMKPSVYLKRQVHAAVMMDTSAMITAVDLGPDVLLFANDYPHSEGTWPESQRRVAKQVEGLPDEYVEQFTHGNAERLYGFTPN